MTGRARRNFLVARMRNRAARVPRRRLDNAVHVLEDRVNSPKASTGEHRGVAAFFARERRSDFCGWKRLASPELTRAGSAGNEYGSADGCGEQRQPSGDITDHQQFSYEMSVLSIHLERGTVPPVAPPIFAVARGSKAGRSRPPTAKSR